MTKLDLDGRVMGTFSFGRFPDALECDGESIWVAASDDTVTRWSLDGQELATFFVGRRPVSLVFNAFKRLSRDYSATERLTKNLCI